MKFRIRCCGLLFQHSPEFLLYKNDLHIKIGRSELLLQWSPIESKDSKAKGCMTMVRWNRKRNGFRLYRTFTIFPFQEILDVKN